MRACALIMIAKGASLRLKDKNRREFLSGPLFEWNLAKMLSCDLQVVFDSDAEDMLERAAEMGATPHLRPPELHGHDVPSVPIFQRIAEDCDLERTTLLNVQANSPNVPSALIRDAIAVLRHTECSELLTVYSDRTINGSLWGFGPARLVNYGDPYVHRPDFLLLDDSVDVHTEDEFQAALARARSTRAAARAESPDQRVQRGSRTIPARSEGVATRDP